MKKGICSFSLFILMVSLVPAVCISTHAQEQEDGSVRQRTQLELRVPHGALQDGHDLDIEEWIKALDGKIVLDQSQDPHTIVSVDLSFRQTAAIPTHSLDDQNISRLATLQDLKSLSLSNRRGFTDRSLIHLGKLEKLETLDLSRTAIDGSGLQLLNNLSELRELNLRGCSNLSDSELKHLSQLPALDRLFLDAMPNSSQHDDGWANDLRRALRTGTHAHLRLAEYRAGAGDEAVRAISDLNLKFLSLNKTRITDRACESLSSMRSLEELHLDYTAVTDQGLAHLAKLTSLRKLSLKLTMISDEGLAQLAKLDNLQSLTLHGTVISDQGLAHLSQLQNLNELDLYFTAVSDDSVKTLAGLEQLRSVNVGQTGITFKGCVDWADQRSDVSLDQVLQWRQFLLSDGGRLDLHSQNLQDKDVEILARYSGLRSLILRDNPISDRGMKYLDNYTGLTTVDLSGTRVTNEGILHLQNCTELGWLGTDRTSIDFAGIRTLIAEGQGRPIAEALHVGRYFDERRPSEARPGPPWYIDLTAAGVDNDELMSLREIQDLVSLKVARNEISAIGAASLTEHARLRTLWIGGPRFSGTALKGIAELPNLEILWVTDSPIKDRDLDALIGMTQLRVLNLCGCEISDDCVETLSQIPQLQTLILETGAISREAEESLTAILPDLEIIRSQQNALRVLRGRQRQELFLPQGVDRRRVQAGIKTRVMEHELVDRFGDEYFEVAVDLGHNAFSVSDDWKQLPTVESIHHVNVDIEAGGLAHLQYFPNLKRLTLYRSRLKNEDLSYVAGMTSLESLELGRTNIDDQGLAQLKDLPGLRTLRLGGYETKITDLRCLVAMPNLEELSVSRTGIDDEDLEYLSHVPRLKHFRARETEITSAGIKHLGRLRDLEWIDLGYTLVDEQALEILGQLPALKNLSLDATYISRDAAERFRSEHPRLQLHLGGFTDESLNAIRSFKIPGLRGYPTPEGDIERLDLRNAELDDARIKHLGGISQLEGVQLSGPLSDQLVEALASLENLKQLRLEKSSISTGQLQKIIHPRRISKLRLYDCKFQDDVMSEINLCTGLTELVLSNCAVTDEDVTKLVDLSELTYLGLSGTKITDTALRAIGNLNELEYLYLNDTAISEVGLRHLAALEKLSYVYVDKVIAEKASDQFRFQIEGR